MLAAITQQAIEAIAADGDHPVFLPHIGLALNLAQPNADTVYRAARITPGGTYRLRGTIGSLPIFKVAILGLTPDQTGGGINAMGYEDRSEEHTSELQSLMRISYAVFCLKKKKKQNTNSKKEYTKVN